MCHLLERVLHERQEVECRRHLRVAQRLEAQRRTGSVAHQEELTCVREGTGLDKRRPHTREKQIAAALSWSRMLLLRLLLHSRSSCRTPPASLNAIFSALSLVLEDEPLILCSDDRSSAESLEAAHP